jgi:putative heme-binding domain-containing protein
MRHAQFFAPFAQSMRNISTAPCLVAVCCMALSDWPVRAAGDDLPACPQGWTVEVVATTQRVLHPTAVACAPDGRIFVCEDYMDMPGPVDRPVNRILCIHPDNRVTVFADQVYVAFSIEYIDGKLYVHHCPRFSVFVDGGDASAGRTDLIVSTNPAPWGSSSRGKNQINDHIPAGFQLAMDGYLYIAVGDKGVHGFVGRDGRHLELPMGGVIRMRPDGTSAEVYATGFRTVLNPAIDARDEIFLYDNNDHLNIYKTAVGQIVDGGYYGYPWDTRPPRPAYVLPMDVRIYEAGAPTGILAYEEDALPEGYRGNLLLCDWGRGELVRLTLGRKGAGYTAVSEERLLAGNARPTCIAIAPDGLSLYLGDWQFPGWRTDVKAGRLLKLTYRGASAASAKPPWFVPAAMGRAFQASTAELVRGLSHPARSVRMVAQRRLTERGKEAIPPLEELLSKPGSPRQARWHAIWTLDAIGGAAARAAVLDAVADGDPSVRAQAVRQLGGSRVAEARDRLLPRLEDADSAVRLQAAAALGRIGAPKAVPALQTRLVDAERLVRHAAATALARIGHSDPAAWDDIVEGLASDRPMVRDGTRLALREIYEAPLVAALMRFAGRVTLPGAVRATAFRALFDLVRMPAEWDGVWWRLGPLGYVEDAREATARPPRTREWAGTTAVTKALHAALDDPNSLVRRAAVESATIALDQGTVDRLLVLFNKSAAADDRPAILTALGSARDPRASGPILAVLRRHAEYPDLLLPAIAAARRQAGPAEKDALARLAAAEIPTKPLVAVLSAAGELKAADAVPAARARLNHLAAEVRTAAVDALARIGGQQAQETLMLALGNADIAVRRRAVLALGELRARAAVPLLLEAYRNPGTRSEAVGALSRVSDARALDVYLEGLGAKNPGVRDECRKSLAALRDEVRPLVRKRLASGELPAPIVVELETLFTGDRDLAPLFARVHGNRRPDDYAAFALANRGDPRRGRIVFDDPRGVGCIKCHRVNGAGAEGGPDLSRIAATYSRAEIVESVLFPSKKMADGFRTTTLSLVDGQVLSGLVIADSGERLVLLDRQGARHDVRKPDIEQRTQSDTSPMPEGLQSGLTPQEFADLIAYMETLTLPPPATAGFDVSGLAHPVCFIVDPGTGNYFIANVNGAPAARDNNGFITKLDPQGKVVALKFIGPKAAAPLHAPKGLAVIGKTLYVLDLDRIRGFNTESGSLERDIEMSSHKAAFLNDLTRDSEGNLYLSDSQANFVARIEPAHEHRVTILAQGPQLAGANGLCIQPRTGRLAVVTWGTGRVLEITREGEVKPWLDRRFEKLDGADFDDLGNLYFSAYGEGKIYRAGDDGTVSVFRAGLVTPADINIDRTKRLMLIPSFDANTARAVPLEMAHPSS